MKRGLRAGSMLSLWTMAALAAPFGCASTVDASPDSSDSGTAADRGARGDGGSTTSDAPGSGACAEWVRTDEEEWFGGELHSDDHLTFDAAGQLQRRRGHIRTGGHGSVRTYREVNYQWTVDRLVVRETVPFQLTVTYTLDGQNVVERVADAASATQRQTVRYVRDDAGRVIERIETRGVSSAETRCEFSYDAAGHLLESDCSDGALSQYQWEGDLPVRRDRSWNGRNRGFDTWRWSATGALLSEHHDDGYGPGRGYRRDHTWDAQGRLLRTDASGDASPMPRVAAVFAYDARGRLEREERSFDAAGASRSVVRWERDAEGRIIRRLAGETGTTSEYTYTLAPTQIDVSVVAGTSRSTRRYRCFASPVRPLPVEPVPGVRIPSTNPTVETYPQARELL